MQNAPERSFTQCLWQGQVILSEVYVANNFWKRFKGLLGTSRIASHQGLLISPCNSVHSLGMAFSITVIFLDAHYQIVRILPDFKPYRLSPLVRGAHHVLETSPALLQHHALKKGDVLQFHA